MADKKVAIKVETLDRLAEGFQESRGITDKLTIEQMIEFAKEPVASGENKLGSFIADTLTEITAADLGDIIAIRAYTFYQSKVMSVEIPSTIQAIAYQAWAQANKLTTVKYNGTTGDWAKQVYFVDPNCSPLGNSIPNLNTMYFRNSQGDYYMVDDVLEITEGTDIIQNYAFNHFTLPRTIIIPSSVKTIENQAFAYCSNCITLTLNEGLETIGNNAFRYCDAIQDLVIPNSVLTINTRAFADSDFLNEVRIGNGIIGINSSAFQNCPNLTDIYIDKPEGSISSAPWGATNATVHWNTPLPSEEV